MFKLTPNAARTQWTESVLHGFTRTSEQTPRFATDAKIFENFERLYSGTDFAELAKARRQELAKANFDEKPKAPSGADNASNSKIILSLLSDSPFYVAGDLMKVKIVAASNMVKAFS